MKSSRLIKKAEKEILTAYLEAADFSEPPHGFDIRTQKSIRSVRLINWRTCDTINRTFLFKARSSGYNYIAIACYAENEDTGKPELKFIDALYRNGKW